MGEILTRSTGGGAQGSVPLARVQNQPFKLAIEHSLNNKYEFCDMKQSDFREFHRFIQGTVGKKLTISQVDDMYLRKRGLGEELSLTETVDGIDYQVLHYGQDRKTFRVFGYYNSSGHLVITRVDGGHDTNNGKKKKGK